MFHPIVRLSAKIQDFKMRTPKKYKEIKKEFKKEFGREPYIYTKLNKDCWNFDKTCLDYMYIHLKKFQKDANTIVELNSKEHNTIEYDNNIYSVNECLETLISNCKYLIKDDPYENLEKYMTKPNPNYNKELEKKKWKELLKSNKKENTSLNLELEFIMSDEDKERYGEDLRHYKNIRVEFFELFGLVLPYLWW